MTPPATPADTQLSAPDQPPLSAAILLRAYEQSHEAILVTSGDNLIVAANGAFCRLSGYTAAELIGTLCGREIPDPHQTMFAMGEAIAHLNYLQNNGRMRRIEENGLIRHIASASRTAHVNNVTP